jgi:hypothetical protein
VCPALLRSRERLRFREQWAGSRQPDDDAAVSVVDHPGVHRYDDFVLYNGVGLRMLLPLAARGLIGRALHALKRR